MRLADRPLSSGAWLAVFVVLAAVPVMAGGLSVETGANWTTLALNGTPFHLTTNEVVNPYEVDLPHSAGVAVIWSEVLPDGQSGNFYAVSLGGATPRVLPTSYRIQLRYASFDPLVETPTVPPSLPAEPASDLYLVQFVTLPLEAFQFALRELGATIHIYVADNTLTVNMTPEVRDVVAQLPFVRWVGPYHPAYKLDETILAALESGDAQDVPQDYSVMAFERGLVPQQAIANHILAMGGTVMNTAADSFRMTVTISPAQALEIARLDETHFIDPWGPGETDMDIVRQIGGAVTVLAPAGYTGEGVRGEIFDSEVDSTHPEWNGQAPLIHATNGYSSTHGTSPYGICFSTGKVQAQATGLMPSREQGIFCWYENSTQFGGSKTRLSLNTEATNPAGPYWSSFQTSSVGSPRTRNYTTISAETDDYLFRVDYLSCQSMSNAGLTPDTRPQAWAKNIVGTGGIYHYNTLSRIDDKSAGSTGPASDNRIKPELAHFYDKTYTTRRGGGYTEFSGTSCATPCTCGHFGLLFQLWHEGVFAGFGGGASVFADRAKSPTAKALMINTAYRYNWKVGGPNSNMYRDRQGWGMVDIGKLYNNRDKLLIVDETDLLTPLAVNTYKVTVPSGESEFAATLVYIDPKGNPAVQTQHRINDLTLKVTDPKGNVYWGNHNLRNDNWSIPGGSANTKDTTENVFIQNPQAGTWTVEIRGDEIVEDSHLETKVLDADYGLVVRGIEPFVLGDMNCDGKVDFGDIDPFVLALSGQAAYYAQYPNCRWLNGDINGDGTVDFDDIDPFVALLGG